MSETEMLVPMSAVSNNKSAVIIRKGAFLRLNIANSPVVVAPQTAYFQDCGRCCRYSFKADVQALRGSETGIKLHSFRPGLLISDGGGEKLVHYGGKNRATGVVAI